MKRAEIMKSAFSSKFPMSHSVSESTYLLIAFQISVLVTGRASGSFGRVRPCKLYVSFSLVFWGCGVGGGVGSGASSGGTGRGGRSRKQILPRPLSLWVLRGRNDHRVRLYVSTGHKLEMASEAEKGLTILLF